MRKIYTPVLLLLSSCTQVNYLGSSYAETQNVDVFVTQASVKKPFEVIGKGYVRHMAGPAPKVETIQRKAVEKAKLKGADAVLIEDYYLVDKTSGIATTDSLRRTQILNDGGLAISSGFTILFLRYKPEP
jgi:hypothetical protein